MQQHSISSSNKVSEGLIDKSPSIQCSFHCQQDQKCQQCSNGDHHCFFYKNSQKSIPSEQKAIDFLDMMEKGIVFIDKTCLIGQTIQYPGDLLIITRPSGFGKTTALKMLKQFFNVQAGNQSINQSIQSEKTFKTQNLQDSCFKNLNISKDKRWQSEFKSHFKNHPTIFIDLKLVLSDQFQLIKRKMKTLLKKLYKQNSYLSKSYLNYKQEQNYLQEDKQDKINQYRLKQSFQILIQSLSKFHDKSCCVLIDDFDQLFLHLLQKKMPLNQIRKRLQLVYECFFNIPKNKHLFKIIAFGKIGVALKSTMPHLTFKVNDLASRNFNGMFGFTRQQIISYIFPKIVNSNVKEDEKQKLQNTKESVLRKLSDWYGGYKIPKKQQTLYNPASIFGFFKQCIQQNMIVHGKVIKNKTKDQILIKHILSILKDNKMLQKMTELLLSQNKSKQISYESLFFQIASKYYQDELCFGHFNYFLLNLGYLCGIPQFQTVKAKIANKQNLVILNQLFKEWAKQRKIFKDFSKINILDMEDVKNKIYEAFKQIKKYIRNPNEALFNSLFAIRYAFSDETTHFISSQKCSGQGRIDNIFLPKQQQQKRNYIIHQYKFCQAAGKVQKLTEEAILQILAQNYMNKYLNNKEKQGKVIIRSVVILYDSLFNNINIQMMEYQFTNEEAQILSEYFVCRYIAKQQSDKRKQRLFKQLGVSSIEQMVQKILGKKIKPKKSPINKIEQKKQYARQIVNYSKIIDQLPNINLNRRLKEKFQKKFTNSTDLYLCKKQDILNIRGFNEKQSEQIYNKLQVLKQEGLFDHLPTGAIQPRKRKSKQQ